MIGPLQQWICDVCGTVIETPKDGYVIWRSDGDGKDCDFKIIHKSRCDDRSYPSSGELSDFLGAEGLTCLLSFLTIGPVMIDNGGKDRVRVKDMAGFVDFLRRLQVPYYEEARQEFDNKGSSLGDANEYYPYLPYVLKNMVFTQEED